MSRTNWADQVTPYTAGTALALLAVALVVQPVAGQQWTQDCGACRSYWMDQGYAGNTTCGPAPQSQGGYDPVYYAWYQCVFNNMTQQCGQDRGNGYLEPCPGPPPQYARCGSGDCSTVTCPQYGGSICTGTCGACDQNYNRCNDLQIEPRPQTPLSVCHVFCGCGNPK